jgi:hypothetical protein
MTITDDTKDWLEANFPDSRGTQEAIASAIGELRARRRTVGIDPTYETSRLVEVRIPDESDAEQQNRD